MPRRALVTSGLLVSACVVLGSCRPAPRGDARPAGSAPAPARISPALPSSHPSGAGDAPPRCEFQAGARVADTLGPDAPRGTAIPIDTFVIVMQENRSFDHYFQALPAFGQPDVDVAPASYSNPDPDNPGTVVKPHLLQELCVPDVPHGWKHVHEEYADGAMNGFVAAANPGGARALGYYDATALPFYYALANTFAIADRYFAAALGPTWPNRMLALAGSAFGHVKNTPPPPRDEERSIFHQLEKRGIDWAIYQESDAFEEKIFPTLRAERGRHFRTLAQFRADASAGKLPALAWVESTMNGVDSTDEHPPGDIHLGQRFVAEVLRDVMTGPQWSRSATLLTYDEHGGFYDHVPPPRACPPDDIPPTDAAGRFDRLGMRVPFIVVSPFAKRHHVSHAVYSHASMLRLVEARFDLPALTRRDANADVPYDMFDFEHPPFLVPPALPEAVVDAGELARCRREVQVTEAELEREALRPAPSARP